MKYLSLFSGIGGFEKGIEQSYEYIQRMLDTDAELRGTRGAVGDSKGRGTKHNINGAKRFDGAHYQGKQEKYVAITKRGAVGKVEEDKKGVSSARGRLVSTARQAIGNPARTGRRNGNGGAQLRHATCVGFSEIDPYAIAVYEQHYPSHKNYGDITKIDAKKLPDFDLLVGGFPCQSFSIAGGRGGFADTRGTLFFEIARILREKQPRLLCLENVKGLLSHDSGNTFTVIIRTLDELGYDLQWQVCNSKNHGVPQNRERIFIVGHLRGTRRPQVFPFGGDDQAPYPFRTARDDAQGDSGYGEGTDGWPTERRKVSQSLDSNYYKGIDNHKQRTLITKPQLRRLTPLECERLQGFPDQWTASQSDTQRYKMLGNAVTVNVVQHIMERLIHRTAY